MTLPSHCAECGVLLMGGATVHKKDCSLYPISYQGLMAAVKTAVKNSRCHCGKPLHYIDEDVKRYVFLTIDKLGEYINVTDSSGRTWRVQRHYIALHGIKEQELSTLGFEEVTDAGAR